MQNGNMYDPMFLAGLAVMQGAPIGDALNQAAMTSYNVQQAQAMQQQQQREQMLMQQMPQLLQQLEGKSPQQALALFAQMGVPPQEAALILERIGSAHGNARTFTGPGGMRYEEYNDPQTGQLMSRKIPGQEERMDIEEEKAARKELERQRKETSKHLKELEAKELPAEEVLNALERGEEAFKELDANTWWLNEPGSFLSYITDPSNTKPGSFTDFARRGLQNLFYNDKALEAQDKIRKLNADLTQSLMSGKSRMLQTDIGKKITAESLPQSYVKRGARKEVYEEFNSKTGNVKASAVFTKKWARAHNGVDEGAKEAYEDFKEKYNLFNQDGKINKEALNKMDEYINQNASSGTTGSWHEEYDKYSDDEIAKAIAKRGR